jgi:diguanylate cyclase (GGDEF)-like protein/PAS domain S-box-containing protein
MTPALLVAAIGLVLAVLAWIAVAAWEEQLAQAQFGTQAATKLAFLQEGFIDFQDVMRSYYALAEGAGGAVDRERLDRFAAPMVAEYTGTSALAWVPVVPRTARSRYPIFRFAASGRPVAVRDAAQYYPIRYSTPRKLAHGVEGFDLGSNPAMLATLERARDRGELVVSEVLPLPIDGGDLGVIALRPVYALGTIPSSIDGRRRHLVGFVLGVFRLRQMVDGTLARLTIPLGIHAYVYRSAAAAGELPIYVHTSLLATSSAPTLRLGVLETQQHVAGVITFGNRSWLAVFVPRQALTLELWGFRPLTALAFWLALSALATGYTLQAGRQRRREAHLASEASAAEHRLVTIFNSVNDGIFLADSDTGTVVDVNHVGSQMFGYAPGELVGRNLVMLSSGIPPYTRAAGRESFAKAQGPQSFNWQVKRKDGSLFWAEISRRKVSFSTGELALAVVRDVTERKRANDQITQMARHDLLTGLANRRVFVEALDQSIARALRGTGSFAVLYLDLDGFKDVNDTLGHPVGDLLLALVADRLRASVRATDTVARFGGDEFAILLIDIPESPDAAGVPDGLQKATRDRVAAQAATAITAGAIAAKILSAIAEPFTIQGNVVRSSASIGIAVQGAGLSDAEAILAHADEALYRAKSEGRGTYHFFTDAMDAEVRARVTMSAELREAIASNQLFVQYQPQVDIESGRIVGLEALARWHHPTRGDLGPAAFIEAAEINGLIVPLGRWVLREVCRQAKQWAEVAIAAPVVAINISGVQFKQPLELEKEIAAALEDSSLAARGLELELTESVLMHPSQDRNDLLQRFRRQGFRIAIDDFGTGYSSLDHLRRYPVDRIKIAERLIADIGQLSGTDAIVRAAIGLARELGIDVVVAGVETAAQVELLKTWGCRSAQGRFFSKSLSAADVTRLLHAGKISPAETGPAVLGRSA